MIKIRIETFIDELMEDFKEISIEDTEQSSFMGLISCCNVIKDPSKKDNEVAKQ